MRVERPGLLGGPDEVVDRGGRQLRAQLTELVRVLGGARIVVGHDLQVLGRAGPCHLFEPGRKPFVELRSVCLREPVVGGVADEDVTEPKGVVAIDPPPSGRISSLRVSASSRAATVPRSELRRQLGDRAAVEGPAHHRRAFGRRSLAGLEAVDASGEERRDRQRHVDVGQVPERPPAAVIAHEPAVVDELGDHLLDEQRVSLGRGGNPRPDLGRQGRPTRLDIDQSIGVRPGQRLEADHLGVGHVGRPPGARLKQLGSSGTQDQQRAVGPGRGQLEHVEELGLGPVDVLDDHHQRDRPREQLKRAADGPGDVVRRDLAWLEAEKGREDTLDSARLGSLTGQCRQPRARSLDRVVLGDPRRRAKDLPDRPVGDPVAVRQAASAEHADVLGHLRSELASEPALADPGRSEDRDEPRCPRVARGLKRPVQDPELVCPPDDRDLRPGTCDARPARPATR